MVLINATESKQSGYRTVSPDSMKPAFLYDRIAIVFRLDGARMNFLHEYF